MTLQQQLRWGGLWIIVTSLLLSVTNIIVYAGKHNAAIQAVYAVGYTGLILTCTIIHVAQARRAGILGLITYLLTLICLVYVNVATFLILAELAGIDGIAETLNSVGSAMAPAIYGIYIGLVLLGILVAQAGVLPRGGGILMALGMALQLPAQFAMDLAGPMFFIFTIGGSIVFGTGLIWIGRALWSGKVVLAVEPRLSDLDRTWGAPFVMLTAVLIIANAFINSIPDLILLDGIINMLSIAAMILAIVILHTTQADRAGTMGLAGFLFLHLGSILLFITAYLITAQLAGQIEDNRALMASWVEIPVGRYGNYMLMLGTLLFGISVTRAGVFPPGSGWLVAVGLALLLPAQFQSEDYLFSIFWIIGATLEGFGLGWMGWTLLKKNPLLE